MMLTRHQIYIVQRSVEEFLKQNRKRTLHDAGELHE